MFDMLPGGQFPFGVLLLVAFLPPPRRTFCAFASVRECGDLLDLTSAFLAYNNKWHKTGNIWGQAFSIFER